MFVRIVCILVLPKERVLRTIARAVPEARSTIQVQDHLIREEEVRLNAVLTVIIHHQVEVRKTVLLIIIVTILLHEAMSQVVAVIVTHVHRIVAVEAVVRVRQVEVVAEAVVEEDKMINKN